MTENQTPAKATTTRACQCGCGESTSSSKTFYRPGHDARHAGIVARDDAASAQEGHERQFSYEDLPTEALRTKARAMAERLVAKATKAPQDRKPKQDAKAAGNKADKKATAELVRQEEEAHAAEEAAKVPTPEWDDNLEFQIGETKVGRWTYPTRTFPDGKVLRNTKRDGSGEWVAL